MRNFCLKRASVALACLGTLLPPSALLGGEAKTPSASQTPKVEIHDVAIAADGHLRGQVLNPQGAPMSNARVALLQGKNEVAVAQTDDQGRFALATGRGGTYVIVAGDAWGVYRAWPVAMAPPTSRPAVLLVANAPVMRGQSSPLYTWISDHPYLFYAGLATAIAVPLVVVDATRDKDPASP